MALLQRLAALIFGQKRPADVVAAHSDGTHPLDQPRIIVSKGMQRGWTPNCRENIPRSELEALQMKIAITPDPRAHFGSNNETPVLSFVQNLPETPNKTQGHLGIGGHFSSLHKEARFPIALMTESESLSLNTRSTTLYSASVSSRKIAKPTLRRSPRVPRPKVLFSGEVLQPRKTIRRVKPIDRSYKDLPDFIGSLSPSIPLSKPRKRPVDPTYRPTTEEMSLSSSTSSVKKMVKKRRLQKWDEDSFQYSMGEVGLDPQQAPKSRKTAHVPCSNKRSAKARRSSMQAKVS